MNQKDSDLFASKKQNQQKMYDKFYIKAIVNLNYKNLNGKYKDAKITVEYYNYDRDNKEKSINYNKKPKPIKKKILKNNFNNNKHEEQYKNCIKIKITLRLFKP
jgi:hypothetical protein